jgi:V/A-type H+-transporting ATPase subunit G/H
LLISGGLEHEKTATVSTSHSAVESIVSALAQLETDIDGMNARVDEMKKRLMAHSNEQIEKLKQQIIAVANEEAKKIVESARAEAEAESATIMKDAEKNLAAIKKNIDSSFDKAVESIVKTVLGQEEPKAEAKKPAKVKKYGSDGKPVSQ